ncbi:hypothetical protein BCR41DRAFT_417958 [Lobosporangium transversale]|uniref:F-box domain-containing protein n=1 Tax=Lobosporangium transversale TaxID=64571 RepID=A0A1Y2H2S3_9FUNG|nr:hypothetical protein BCR41DRAFT_417958 [Lobosporangium transversale]ORZ28848.1 hypothetical protein BCR41DRAFT_417958 [Lobosporangium transversale]|eukprot:XP_021886521.1 hypothetical protein BCR41DRAFT_417958 [Lobosporangium transversale]
MENIKLSPLDIPEIISLIGEHLNRRDLINCIRVSKVFHRALIRSRWREINIVCKYPTGEALENNKKYIEELRFESRFPKEYGLLKGCDRLQFIDYKREFGTSSQLNYLSNLIKAHYSTLTRICFDDIQSSHEFWGALLECTNLKRLEVSYTRIKDEVGPFLQVCKGLARLTLRCVSIFQLPSNFISNEANEFSFLNIHTLSITAVEILKPPHPYTASSCLGILARRCPGLCELTFVDKSGHGGPEQLIINDFYRTTFQQYPWVLANLSYLSLPYMRIKDKDMMALLSQITELRHLDVRQCKFGHLSLQELLADKQEMLDKGHILRKTRPRRLCEALEVLMFDEQSVGMDGIVQAVLSNCPRLKQLTGTKITITEIVNGTGWVCTELTDLNIYLKADVDQGTIEGMAKARIAFRELGKLTQLQYLSLTSQNSNNEERIRTIDLRLRAGLDELVNLKNLVSLWFYGDNHQRMQLEDATWIVGNWPRIKYLKGLPNIASYRTTNPQFYLIWRGLATIELKWATSTTYVSLIKIYGPFKLPTKAGDLKAQFKILAHIPRVRSDDTESLPLTGEALQKHKEHIEELHFKHPGDDILEEYGSLQGCSRLWFIKASSLISSEPIHFLNLFKAHNSTITKVILEDVQSSQLLWDTLLGCINLNHLEVISMSIDDGVDIFFQVCKKLGYLDFNDVFICRLPTDFLSSEVSEHTFPNIHTLHIDRVRIFDPSHPYTPSHSLGMLVRCPGLYTLKFGKNIQVDYYKEAFFQHPWTLHNLAELSSPSAKITDSGMVVLLRQTTGLTWLNVPGCEFGQLSLQGLLTDKYEVLNNGQMVQKEKFRRACETVEILILNEDSDRPDGIVQAILSNCPRLRKLTGPRITVTEIVDGVGWVCTGLTDLHITLVADVDQETEEGMAMTRVVYKELGKLTQLRYLWLTKDYRDPIVRTLNLRLRAGLGELVN